MQKIFTTEKIVAFLEILEKGKKIAILTHFNPDGDAIGAAGALKAIIKNIYPRKIVRAFVPNDYPDFLAWTAKDTDIEVCKSHYKAKMDYVRNADTIIVADMNFISRAEHISEPFLQNTEGRKILIDHHIGPNIPSLDVMFHSEDASSTCFLVYKLIKATGWWDKVDTRIVSALLCGIITDTGGFSYSGLTGELFRAVGELVDKGADPVAIHQAVFDNMDELQLRLRGHLLNDNMVVIPEKNAAYITISALEKKLYKYKPGYTEGLVNIPMSTKGISTSALFIENKDHIKVSLRSQGDKIDVNKMCNKWFNGGGHFNAAGGKFYGTMKEAVETYYKALENYDKL